ncbi:MAG: tyrosine-protein phosphatase [Pseudomonadota bacterium]|nr:tyrosine-protein phosphatase [Pseudomonadota bacterium]
MAIWYGLTQPKRRWPDATCSDPVPPASTTLSIRRRWGAFCYKAYNAVANPRACQSRSATAQARTETAQERENDMSDQPKIEIPGALNFRSVPSFSTAHGHIRANQLFRCGAFDLVGDEGQQALKDAQATRIFDLRSEREKVVAPSPMIGNPDFEILTTPHNIKAGDLAEVLKNEAATPDDCRAAMRRSYRKMPGEFRDIFAGFLRAAAAPDGAPIVVHCTAGKDRTGIVVAILLDFLGVSYADILSDYLESNTAAGELTARLDRRMASLHVTGLRPEIVEVLNISTEANLSGMFDALHTEFGTTESYIRDHLGLTDAEVEQLRKNILA